MPVNVTAMHIAVARFGHRLGRLKLLKRTGWRDRGVATSAIESVADHSFRLALLAWVAALAAGAGLDATRVLKLALIHDLAEALTGDPPPYDETAIPTDAGARRRFLERWHVRDPARAAAKAAAEATAMATLLADLPPVSRAEFASLWTEYQAQTTAEARFVKQADRLETFMQSREYLAADPALPMAAFAAEAAATITDPWLAGLRDASHDLPAPPAAD